MAGKYKDRFKCPCCRYPTLDEQGLYDICLMCDWEDDGQNDSNADRVLGGPNGGYSLTQARNNFKQYFIMYSPGEDMRIIGRDTKKQIAIKKELCKLYDKLITTNDENEIKRLDDQINYLEETLYNSMRKD